MKKVYKKGKFKKWHDYRAQRIGETPKRSKQYNPNKVPVYRRAKQELIRAKPVVAPSDICLLSKSYSCLDFFAELRKDKNISKMGRTCFVQMDISLVEHFDYSSICVLIAIIRDLKSKKIYLRGNYPKNQECKRLIIESGILTFMFDDNGKPFEKAEKSDLLFIEKGSRTFTRADNKRVSDTVKNAVNHLTGEYNHFPKLRRILLEICGNSLEWGDTLNKQWLLGVKYDEGKAIFTVTDVGKGILKTLNKKFRHKLKDTFTLKENDEILKGAFVKRYGSNTREINRNKGLPAIKNGFDSGIITNLKVVTNDVILHFDQNENSEVLKNNYFSGTLYQWEITKETIQKAS